MAEEEHIIDQGVAAGAGEPAGEAAPPAPDAVDAEGTESMEFDSAFNTPPGAAADGGAKEAPKDGEKPPDPGKEAAGKAPDSPQEGQPAKEGAPVAPPTAEDRLKAKEAALDAKKAPEAADTDDVIVADVAKARPNVRQVLSDPAFQAWVAARPDMQQKATEGGVQGGIEVLDAWAAANGGTAQGQPAELADLDKVTFKAADGTETTLKQFSEDYGEVFPAVVAAANQIAQKTTKQAIAQALDPIKQELAQARAELAQVRASAAESTIMAEVRQKHSDADKVIISPEFKEWGAKQSPARKRLWREGGAEDVVDILDAFKEQKAREQLAAKKDSQTKKKAEKDDLHKGSIKGTVAATPEGGPPKDEEEEFASEFNKANAK